MKHIILFSGGANSSYVAWLVAQKQKKEDIILLHTPTYSEHPDADRFRNQVSKFLDIPITVQADGRDIWQLIRDHHCLPSDFIPFCSSELKSEEASIFYKTMTEKFIVYLGFGLGEWRRAQTSIARLAVQGIESKYPLLEQDKLDPQIKDIIRNEWRICLPEPYLYLNHNNCLPCFKGGVPHFYQIWKYYREYFNKAVEAENLIGHTVFKDKSLTEYSKLWEAQQPLFNDEDFDMRPCMCAL
jgi:hypothetical protein